MCFQEMMSHNLVGNRFIAEEAADTKALWLRMLEKQQESSCRGGRVNVVGGLIGDEIF